jgi:hypothetical protein
MVDLGILSASAILVAAQYFGKKVLDGVASGMGGKVVDWLKEKLTAPTEKAALSRLAEAPTSEDARRTLEGIVLSRLEQDSSLVEGLASLLKEAGTTIILKQDTKGISNTENQIVGSGNVVISNRG